MLFNSIEFLLFFPVVAALYFAVPHRYRWILLLVASYFFYMCWKPEYAILMIISTFIDYWAALQMGRHKTKKKRKKYLIFSLVANFGLLFSFKYFNFFSGSLTSIFQHFDLAYNFPTLKVLVPVGISFYTFQTISYGIDVYRGVKEPERHLGIFALYVSFFPQLVAGPIERSTNLLPQLRQKHEFDYTRISNGLKLALWGLFKKIVIADRLAIVVNQVYNNPAEHSGMTLIIATYFFAIQILCDFSGYSDIAIGTAKVFGVDLMMNFNRPYLSKSISEFWQRWHISLSTWFKDYLYIPLGGNRVSAWKLYRNIMIVFLLSGLWHGANWTFIVWGILHGFYLLFSLWTRKIRSSVSDFLQLDQFPMIHKCIKVFITFNLVSLAWIFFRANSFSDAVYIITHLFNGFSIAPSGILTKQMFMCCIVIVPLVIVDMVERKQYAIDFLAAKPVWVRQLVYLVLIFAIIHLGIIEKIPFIYFQF